jgi:hypothetical protein
MRLYFTLQLLLLALLRHSLAQSQSEQLNDGVSDGVSAVQYSFTQSALYSCSAHCSSLGLRCDERGAAARHCLEAAQQITRHSSADSLYAVKSECSAGGGCFVDRYSLVSEGVSEGVREEGRDCM